MTQFFRLTLSATLLTALALPVLAAVPAQHRAPAKAHAVRGPVRHVAATGTDAVRTPAVSSTAVAAPAANPATPSVTTVAPGVTTAAPKAATAPTTVAPAMGTTAPAASTTAAVPTVTTKPAVKTN